jgi:hypothetical protein
MGPIEIYEIPAWKVWAAAESAIGMDRATYAFVVGPSDTKDSGWVVYVEGHSRGEVGSRDAAIRLLGECLRPTSDSALEIDG